MQVLTHCNTVRAMYREYTVNDECMKQSQSVSRFSTAHQHN